MAKFALQKEIYEYLGQQIVDDYKITAGRCLDIGTGAGILGLDVGKRSSLQVYLLDIDPEGLLKAESNCRDSGLASRTCIVRAPVEDLPFIDSYFDLVISRGSIFFWKDRVKGLSEVYRVLKTGGVAYIGGGVSRLMPRDQAEEFVRWARPRHHEQHPDWDDKNLLEIFKGLLITAGIQNYSLSSENGTWIEIKK
jgi:ubiquinone/menaquinone biosynthesis C-methylase UbiE